MIIENIQDRLRKELNTKLNRMYGNLSRMLDKDYNVSMPRVDNQTNYHPTDIVKFGGDPMASFGWGPLKGMVASREIITSNNSSILGMYSFNEQMVEKMANVVEQTQEKIKQADLDVKDVTFRRPYDFGKYIRCDHLSDLIGYIDFYHSIQDSGKRELCILNYSGPGCAGEMSNGETIRERLEKWDKPEMKEMSLEDIEKTIARELCDEEFAPIIMGIKHKWGFKSVTYVRNCMKTIDCGFEVISI